MRGTKPKTIWENLHFRFLHSAVGSATFSVISPEPLRTDNIGTAVIHRMIGHIDMAAVGTDATQQIGAFGVCVLSRDAATAGTVPEPLSDTQQAWYYWTVRNAIGEPGGNRQMSWDFDIRTKRRLRSGYDLVWVWENTLNELAVDVDISIRSLWSVWG